MIEALRARRKSLGISQEALCHQLGVSNGIVQKWETGAKMPGAFFLMCWAQALKLNIACLASD